MFPRIHYGERQKKVGDNWSVGEMVLQHAMVIVGEVGEEGIVERIYRC